MTEQHDEITKVETRVQMGSFEVIVGGVPVRHPVPLTITDTYWASGRKDVKVQVPRLEATAEQKKGV